MRKNVASALTERSGSTAVLGKRSVALAALAFTALVPMAACGSSDNNAADTTASQDGQTAPTTDVSNEDVIENSGTGEVESFSFDPKPPTGNVWGSQQNPISAAYLQRTAGYLNYQRPDVCQHPDLVSNARPFTREKINATYNDVYVEINGSVNLYVLACSGLGGAIWPGTNGPGGEGISVPCPGWAGDAVDGFGAVYYSYTKGGGWAGNMTESAGGYGSKHDGLWNYRFHNWNNQDVSPRISLLCQFDDVVGGG